MKTNVKSLVNKYISLPLTHKEQVRIARGTPAKISSTLVNLDTPPRNLMQELNTSEPIDDHLVKTFETLSTEVIDEALSRVCVLTAGQRTRSWFITRIGGFTSTTFPKPLTFENNYYLLQGLPVPTLETWAHENVPEYLPSSELADNVDLAKALHLLAKLGGSDLYEVPPSLVLLLVRDSKPRHKSSLIKLYPTLSSRTC